MSPKSREQFQFLQTVAEHGDNSYSDDENWNTLENRCWERIHINATQTECIANEERTCDILQTNETLDGKTKSYSMRKWTKY